MRSFSFFLISLVLMLYFGAMQIFAQKSYEPVGNMIVKIDDMAFVVPVNSRLKIPLYEREGFRTESSERICDISFNILAVEKKFNEAIITLDIWTQDEQKNSSFDRKFKLKSGESKSFKVKSKLKCLNYKSFAVVANYETKNKAN